MSENKSEFIQWWLNYSPFASWEELAGQLYHIKVLPKALKCAKQSFDHIPGEQWLAIHDIVHSGVSPTYTNDACTVYIILW